MEEFEKHIKTKLCSRDWSPSALVLSFYYTGGVGRFDKLRAIADQLRKDFYATSHKQ